LVSRTEHMRIY